MGMKQISVKISETTYIKVEIQLESIYHEILVKTCPYMINLVKHTVFFFLTILIIWFTIKFTELLFPSLPFVVKILLLISEVALIIHFARESMDDG
jgi:hypothetical protein